MKKEKFQYQRKRASTNREKIIKELLLKNEMKNKELIESVVIAAPTLSHHLKKLRKEGVVDVKLVKKLKGKDEKLYFLTEKANKLPEVRNLFFEIAMYHKILRELCESGEPIRFSTNEMRSGFRERLIYWDLSSEYLENKSEYEIVEALDKWLSPIVVFAIIQELKGKTNFTETIQGLIEKLIEVVEKKELTKLEEALNQVYSKKIDFDDVSIMKSLEEIINNVEKQKMVDELFDKNFREYKSSLESGVDG